MKTQVARLKEETSLPFSETAIGILAERYLMKSDDGTVIETPEKMFHRIATCLATLEQRFGKTLKEICDLEAQFYEVMASFKFCPAGRTLALAGNPTRSLVCNCVVLHMKDSLDSIFETLAEAATLQQAGSGIGFPFGMLRPVGRSTKRTGGMSSGPVSFMHIYNAAFGVIKLSGRHGANMSVLGVDHPDILEFITCKQKEGALQNFNISVSLTDEFMQKVVDNDTSPWLCSWKGKKMKPRKIFRDDNFNLVQAITPVDISAPELFDMLVEASYNNGEPGCIFIDTVNSTNQVPALGRIHACNPCGEQYLLDGEACNLGSVNLALCVKEDRTIDFDGLASTVKIAVRMLDNVIDIVEFPVERVQRRVKENRRVGLGIMGFADMLVSLGIGYNTAKGRETAEKVMKFINEVAHDASRELAEEKGVFANYDKSIYYERGDKHRNLTLTNCPPTGTTGLLFDVNGGVEPFFKLAYTRTNHFGNGTTITYVNEALKKELKKLGIDPSGESDVMKQILKEGSIQNTDLPQELKDVFITAMDIPFEDHLLMQASLQKYCDNAISKTINFPNEATKEDVKNCYIKAWTLKCKGLTVYRDQSRNIQVLNSISDEAQKTEEGDRKEELKACPLYDGKGGNCTTCDI